MTMMLRLSIFALSASPLLMTCKTRTVQNNRLTGSVLTGKVDVLKYGYDQVSGKPTTSACIDAGTVENDGERRSVSNSATIANYGEWGDFVTETFSLSEDDEINSFLKSVESASAGGNAAAGSNDDFLKRFYAPLTGDLAIASTLFNTRVSQEQPVIAIAAVIDGPQTTAERPTLKEKYKDYVANDSIQARKYKLFVEECGDSFIKSQARRAVNISLLTIDPFAIGSESYNKVITASSSASADYSKIIATIMEAVRSDKGVDVRTIRFGAEGPLTDSRAVLTAAEHRVTFDDFFNQVANKKLSIFSYAVEAYPFPTVPSDVFPERATYVARKSDIVNKIRKIRGNLSRLHFLRANKKAFTQSTIQDDLLLAQQMGALKSLADAIANCRIGKCDNLLKILKEPSPALVLPSILPDLVRHEQCGLVESEETPPTEGLCPAGFILKTPTPPAPGGPSTSTPASRCIQAALCPKSSITSGAPK